MKVSYTHLKRNPKLYVIVICLNCIAKYSSAKVAAVNTRLPEMCKQLRKKIYGVLQQFLIVRNMSRCLALEEMLDGRGRGGKISFR